MAYLRQTGLLDMSNGTLKGGFCWSLAFVCLLIGCKFNGDYNPKTFESGLNTSFVYPSNSPKVAKLLDSYRKKGALSTLHSNSEHYAKNIMSWQMEHGGFGVHDITFYEKLWDGNQKRSEWVSKGQELGNFDDGATVAEVRFLAEVYRNTKDASLKRLIKESVDRCLHFIFTSQYENGGWPQVYPRRHKRPYSNNVTLNDDAMIRTMVLLSDILAGVAPFDTHLVAEDIKADIYPRLSSAVSYLLKAQIVNDNELTIWSSQYDIESNAPASARSYELKSKSGRESVGVLAYLMNWPEQDEKVIAAVSAGVAWYKANKVRDIALINGEFIEETGSELWYRFYEVDSSVPFFAGRDGIKKYDLALVEDERRKGYSWGSNYASKVLRAAPLYFEELRLN